MSAQVIDFAAVSHRRYARDMAHRAIQSIRVSPATVRRGDTVLILGTDQIGAVIRTEGDGRVWVRLDGLETVLAPADRVVRLDGPEGAA